MAGGVPQQLQHQIVAEHFHLDPGAPLSIPGGWQQQSGCQLVAKAQPFQQVPAAALPIPGRV